MSILENAFHAICAQILPTSCIACAAFQAETLCPACRKQLEAENLLHYECCQQCGTTLARSELLAQRCNDCVDTAPYFDETYCLDRYEGKLQAALHQLKYHKRLAFAHGLATSWNHIAAQSIFETNANYLLPVPLSKEKLCLRGFNQSWEIARRIHLHPQIKRLPNALLRRHSSQSLALENKLGRRIAIQGLFHISPQFQAILKNKTVIVFDDVMTSGATLNEIARVLKDNGVSRVINWVLLRTARPTPLRNAYV
ncbi:comF family protein [Polynucleobacter meluiroseus]|uniref:ComF family protein n=1 Tax=Polynucleobacter meluiroseus TaxID=1938814 RepID=A0A240DYX1_9BURK|nr:ComF family protein [Polynucleobacter meluiroseus]SNX27810.1 comF family protein [Polynucleobacter meluiroseus]